MDLGLKNSVALITGASRGLGFATARLMAQEGAHVVINSRSQDKLSEAAKIISETTGQKVLSFPGDVAQPDLPEKLVDFVVQQFGGIDILVANAGGPPPGNFTALNDDTWLTAFELNFMSNVRLIRAALPYLKKSDRASVLTITSHFTKQPTNPNLILSTSIRSATIGLTKSLALELAGQGIRFNSILPAWTDTERVQNLMINQAKTNGTTVEEEIRKTSADSPMGRMGRPDEFANAAVFLVSPAASYITGTMLNVDGGMNKSIY